jgi:hypothetical protein
MVQPLRQGREVGKALNWGAEVAWWPGGRAPAGP